jgi:hypothetical protein
MSELVALPDFSAKTLSGFLSNRVDSGTNEVIGNEGGVSCTCSHLEQLGISWKCCSRGWTSVPTANRTCAAELCGFRCILRETVQYGIRPVVE